MNVIIINILPKIKKVGLIQQKTNQHIYGGSLYSVMLKTWRKCLDMLWVVVKGGGGHCLGLNQEFQG